MTVSIKCPSLILSKLLHYRQPVLPLGDDWLGHDKPLRELFMDVAESIVSTRYIHTLLYSMDTVQLTSSILRYMWPFQVHSEWEYYLTSIDWCTSIEKSDHESIFCKIRILNTKSAMGWALQYACILWAWKGLFYQSESAASGHYQIVHGHPLLLYFSTEMV